MLYFMRFYPELFCYLIDSIHYLFHLYHFIFHNNLKFNHIRIVQHLILFF